jgi:hypothetical protein
MYKESASHSEQAECVASLVLKTEEVRMRFGFSDQDARSVVLNNVRSIAYTAQMVLNLLDSWCIGNEAVRDAIPQLLGLINVSDRSVKVAGDTLHKTAKLSLVILGQFQIETCLRNLARELNIKMPNRGFYPLTKSLIAFLGLPGVLVDELNVAAFIRNSLHGNGIHSGYKGRDTVTTLDNVTYEFLHQQPVSCATVEHIAHALESSVNILATIFDTQQVSVLKDPVIDRHVQRLQSNRGS